MKEGSVGDDRSIAYAMSAWDQAWTHYRHLETTRDQYLGFFFTAVLGVIAIAGPRLADDSFSSPSSLVILATLTVGLEFLTAFLYLAVIRLNSVLAQYLKVIAAFLETFVPASREVVDLRELANLPVPVRPWAATSRVAENVLRLGLLGLLVVLGGTLVRAVGVLGWSTTTLYCVAAMVAGLITAAAVRFGFLGTPASR
jgi:hypothetical protein